MTEKNYQNFFRTSTLFFIILLCTTTGIVSADISIRQNFNIQEKINHAQNGDIIVVPDGIYPGNIDFQGKAITLVSEHGPQTCIIDGQGTTPGVLFHTNETSRSILKGFTITHCKAENSEGGGIFCGQDTSPTIIQCIIKNNIAQSVSVEVEASGAGVFCDRLSSPTFIACTISNNHVRNSNDGYTQGGGVCAFYSSPSFSQCWITNNMATADGAGGAMGGGIAAFYGGHITLRNCMITNNVVNGNGFSYRMGGGLCLRYGQLATIQGCTFSENQAVISGCPYQAFGAGLYVGEGGDADIRNTILWHDIWNGTAQEIFISDPYTNSHVNIDFSDIEGGQDAIIILNATYHEDLLIYGTMNIADNPVFSDPLHQDFHILITSPCVDSGEPRTWDAAIQPVNTNRIDIDGNPRIIDIPWIHYPGRGPIDIGADEVLIPL